MSKLSEHRFYGLNKWLSAANIWIISVINKEIIKKYPSKCVFLTFEGYFYLYINLYIAHFRYYIRIDNL